jgi:hypothetical protein
MNFRDLLPPVTDLNADFSTAISAWRWLLKGEVAPLLLTALGDLFLEIQGEVFFLNTAAGDMTRVGSSRNEWKQRLQDETCIASWFRPDIVAELREGLGTLKPGEVYSPIVPAVLGGGITKENFTASQWRMHLHFLGQVHEQVHDLPAGTRIDKVTIDPIE